VELRAQANAVLDRTLTRLERCQGAGQWSVSTDDGSAVGKAAAIVRSRLKRYGLSQTRSLILVLVGMEFAMRIQREVLANV
jgi:hypothetical protein